MPTEVGGITGGGTILGVVGIFVTEALISDADLLALYKCFSSSGLFLKAIQKTKK